MARFTDAQYREICAARERGRLFFEQIHRYPQEPEQVSTPETVMPIKAITEAARAEEGVDKPTKVDLSTFDLQVKGEGRLQHKMTLGTGRTGQTQVVHGKDLKPTLLRLLEQHGITGSDAEIEATLVLHPDSDGRNRMIDIIKGRG